MPDLSRQIADLEAEIDALAASAERCRKAVLLGRAATAAGGLALLALVSGLLRPQALPLVLALAGLVGGLAFTGSSGGTYEEIRAAIRQREARRRELIDALELQAV